MKSHFKLLSILTVIAYAFVGVGSASAQTGPVAWWAFDEASGTVLNDSSGNGNTAYINTATWVPGVSGSALSFNGTSDYAYANNSASLNMSNQLSIECWVNVRQLGYNIIIRKEGGYFLGISTGGNIAFFVNISSGWHGTWTLSQQTLQTSTWYHIVGVWDGTFLKVFVNGVADANTYVAYGTMTSDTNAVYFASYSGSDEFLNGTLDELKLYNYALTADSVAAHYLTTNIVPVVIPYTPNPTTNRQPQFRWYSNTLIPVFRIQFATSNQFSSPIASTTVTDTTYTPTSNLPFGTIYWRVGNNTDTTIWSQVSSVIIADSVLSPSLVNVTALTCHSVQLTWQNHDTSTVGYIILRKDSTATAYHFVDSVKSATQLTYRDLKNLHPTTLYTYEVQAYNTLVVSYASNSMQVTTPAAPSALTWVVVTPPPTNYNLHSVTYGNGQYMAVGDNGTVLTSPDGIAWTSQASGTSNNPSSVTYGNGQFVAACSNGYVITSPNGISWTMGGGTGMACYSVTYGNGQYVATGESYTTSLCPLCGVPHLITYGTILTSPDGINWIDQLGGPSCTGTPTCNRFIPATSSFVTYCNNQYIAENPMRVSPDGITWTSKNTCTGNSITYGNGQYVSVGNGGGVITSPDDSICTSQASGTSNNFNSVTYGSGQYVTVGSTGTILNSPDAINWAIDASGTGRNLNSVVYSNGIFVAVGDSGTIVVTSSGGTILSAPVLISPDSAAQNQPVSLSLIWHKVSTATSYTVQLSTSSNFSSLVMGDSAATDTFKVLSGLTGGTTYYWRVRAKNASGGSPWANRRFTTIALPPATPVLVSPANSAVAQPISLSLIWTKVSTATSYYVQVATDTGFISIFTQDSTVTDSLKPISGLANSATYYWRVRAKNAGGTSSWTSRWSFTTIVAPAGTLTLVSPANGAADQPISLSLVWNKVSTATSYYVQVATDTGFTNIFTQDSTVTDSLKAISGLANSTVYYWRVRAKNAGGTSNWTSRWSFTTIIAAAATPMLVSPATGTIGQPLSLSLVWNKSSTATSYYFQIATDTGFTGIFKQDSTLTDTVKSDSGFALSTLYYWRVRAKNAGGSSAWSPVWNFTTIATGVLSSRSLIPHAFSITGSSGMVRYGLPVQCHVVLKYYDLRGRLTATLVNGMQQPGYYALSVRNALPSNGSYIRIFEAGTFVKRELVPMVGK